MFAGLEVFDRSGLRNDENRSFRVFKSKKACNMPKRKQRIDMQALRDVQEAQAAMRRLVFPTYTVRGRKTPVRPVGSGRTVRWL
jgi:hypothetical protein